MRAPGPPACPRRPSTRDCPVTSRRSLGPGAPPVSPVVPPSTADAAALGSYSARLIRTLPRLKKCAVLSCLRRGVLGCHLTPVVGATKPLGFERAAPVAVGSACRSLGLVRQCPGGIQARSLSVAVHSGARAASEAPVPRGPCVVLGTTLAAIGRHDGPDGRRVVGVRWP